MSGAAAVEVVTLGEAMIALVAGRAGPLHEAESFNRYVAGAEANVATGLTRLGHPASFIGRVGDDGFGRAIVNRLRGEGVDVRHVTVDGTAPTGVFFRERRGFGSSEVIYWRAGSAASHLGPEDVQAAADRFREASWLHLTGITPALSPGCHAAVHTALDLAAAHGTHVCLDVNLRRKLWSEAAARSALVELLPRCRLVLAGEDEAEVLTGESVAEAAARALVRLGAETAVVKRGPLGALSVGPDGVCRQRPGRPIPVPVDVVGAGDAFAAGYLAAMLEERPPEVALEVGNLCGAYVVLVEGDTLGMPSRAELESALKGSAYDVNR